MPGEKVSGAIKRFSKNISYLDEEVEKGNETSYLGLSIFYSNKGEIAIQGNEKLCRHVHDVVEVMESSNIDSGKVLLTASRMLLKETGDTSRSTEEFRNNPWQVALDILPYLDTPEFKEAYDRYIQDTSFDGNTRPVDEVVAKFRSTVELDAKDFTVLISALDRGIEVSKDAGVNPVELESLREVLFLVGDGSILRSNAKLNKACRR